MGRIPDAIYPTPKPGVGLVIGTYAAAPYVHLGLESVRRNCSSMPVLVHDDASGEDVKLQDLCRQYGADFSGNSERLGHFNGDLAVFVAGLEWARRQQIKILVKFSRRFIPLFDWIPDLQVLAWSTQYATFSNIALSNGLRFRTECVALHVDSWFASGAADALQRQVEAQKGVLVEAFFHRLAREVHQVSCAKNREYELLHPNPREGTVYGVWKIMGNDRHRRLYNVLWRHSCSPIEYCRAACQYGLAGYAVEHFLEVPGAKSIFDASRSLE